MNRNVLKIIALVTMLIDHIGFYFFSDIIALRIIGRLSFPIFAFFIAEGWKHTHSKPKYFLTLLIFAFISQVPYALLKLNLNLNILFTFIFALSIIWCFEKYKDSQMASIFIFLPIAICMLTLSIFGMLDYGILGVGLVLVFYYFNKKTYKLLLASLVLVLMTGINLLVGGWTFRNSIQIFSLLSIILIYLYNGNKGRLNLKYIFYIFYPLHLVIIYICSLMI